MGNNGTYAVGLIVKRANRAGILKFAAFAWVCALGACTLAQSIGNRIRGGFGALDGCMYYRSNIVPPPCISRIVYSGDLFPMTELARCMDAHIGRDTSTAVSVPTTFTDENGRQSVKNACFFDGSTRNFYRYEEAKGGAPARLYTRSLSCRQGCIDERSFHVLEITSGGVRAVSPEK